MNWSECILLSVVDAIGATPLVQLNQIAQGVPGRILAKLEYFNPGLSKKDRIAQQIIEDAEADGALRPGQTVVELTSGNMGIGLAIICGSKGYPFVAVMSRGNSTERARMMAALGAEVVLIEQLPDAKPGQVSGGDLDLVEQETQSIVRERGGFRADQFNNVSNARAHLLHTGPEIIRQCAGQLHAFCDFAGSGGSFAGCSEAFKRSNPAIQCFIVEPAGAAVLAGEPAINSQHRIQGGGYSRPHLALLKPEYIDGYLQVTDEEAAHMARRLAKEDGIFAGFSSGANVAAAMKLLKTGCRGQSIAVLINDSALKYLSTDLFE